MKKTAVNIDLIMYTGPHCELCEHAQEVFEELKPPDVSMVKVNIRDDSQLYHLYAVRIPVLKRQDSQAELAWPFDVTMLEQFLK
ncbi:glutaredoxin family protein [Glaciecola sp. SC05]|uniref:glutaredoxin family protein n=1 Tax=Glaciecola sp. SC05 TaxID=1987355 RepID=UPI0035275EAC